MGLPHCAHSASENLAQQPLPDVGYVSHEQLHRRSSLCLRILSSQASSPADSIRVSGQADALGQYSHLTSCQCAGLLATRAMQLPAPRTGEAAKPPVLLNVSVQRGPIVLPSA